jgi:hypothetical protein
MTAGRRYRVEIVQAELRTYDRCDEALGGIQRFCVAQLEAA